MKFSLSELSTAYCTHYNTSKSARDHLEILCKADNLPGNIIIGNTDMLYFQRGGGSFDACTYFVRPCSR